MSRVPPQMKRVPRLPSRESRPYALPVPRRFKLSGGLPVLHLPRHDLPLVHLSVVVRSGHAADPSDLPGLAFTTAALVDEGAGRRSALEISGDLQELGTALHIAVDAESTTLSVDLLREQLEPVVAILADVLLKPHLSAEELERIQAEIASRGEDRRSSPSQIASLCFSRAVFGAHPYGRPALPLPHHVERIRRREVVRFHRRHYRPGNALLMVAGAVSQSDLLRLAERELGRWTDATGVEKLSRRHVPKVGPRLVLMPREGATESVLRVGHGVPARRSLDTVHVQLLNTAFGGSFTSRLNLNLRERHGYTYGANSSVNLMRQHGMLAVGAQVERDVTAPALREVMREMHQMVKRPVTRRELLKAKALVVEDLPASAETLSGLAEAYLELTLHREALGSLNRLPLRVDQTRREDLRILAGRLFRPEEATIVVVGDTDSFRGALEQAYGPAEVHDVDGVPLPG